MAYPFDFEYKRSLDHSQPMSEIVNVAASQTIKAGQVLVVASGLAAKAAAAPTAGTVLGIALADITTSSSVGDSDKIPVLMINEKSVTRVGYIGTDKTSLTAADRFGTCFDIAVDGTTGVQSLNLDDTIGGFLKVVGYDNTSKTADVVFDAYYMWNTSHTEVTG